MILDGEVGGSYDISRASRVPLDFMQQRAAEAMAAPPCAGRASGAPTPIIMYQTQEQSWEASGSTVRSAAEATWWKLVHGDLQPFPKPPRFFEILAESLDLWQEGPIA